MATLDDIVTVTAVPAVSAETSNRITFSNNRSRFRQLAMRGAMLEFVTVGFYRFWLATDMRRHLWSHTSVEDDTVEYTGRAKELLIGFLFAVAILAPVYLAYFLIGLEAERLKAFASTPLGLFFYFFMQFAIYRARRYRLTRTVWRGVRFSMTGSGWNYAWRAALWSLFVALTLGLALPWRQAALERFKMRHTAYGDLQGRFDGKGWALFKRGWWLWLLLVLIFVVPLFGAGVLAVQKSNAGAAFLSVVPWFILLIVGPFIYGTYKAIEWKWWISGLRIGAVSFTSDLKRSALFGLYWKVIGWSVLLMAGLSVVVVGLMGLFGAFAALGHGAGAAKIAAMSQQLPVIIVVGLTYVIAALAFGVVLRVYLMHDVWKRVAESTTVNNLAVAQDVAARGELVGALGEGFADSFDVVGF